MKAGIHHCLEIVLTRKTVKMLHLHSPPSTLGLPDSYPLMQSSGNFGVLK